MNSRKLLTALAIGLAVGLFFQLDLNRWLSLAALQEQRGNLLDFYAENRLLTAGAYFGTYVLVTALSLPGAAVMTLVGGAIFGVLWGTLLVSFASTLGATLAFLLARFLFRDAVQQRFARQLRTVNEGVEREGALYLFLLRLVPLFPFFVINLVLALTPMRTRTFYGVSQIGMLAGTLVYVNAGTQLAQLEGLSGILSPGLWGAFALLGAFPLLARQGSQMLQRRQALRGWNRPRDFDRNLVVIGGGAAGLVTAYIAAAVQARVTLIERAEMGGDCLNTGCVPSKALLRTARYVSGIARHSEFGVRRAESEHTFAEVMDRVRAVVARIEPHDSVERYEGLGVEVLRGEARITSPWTVEVGGRTLSTRHIVVATGARPFLPDIPGLPQMDPLTSETIWSLRENPGRLLLLGGGAIGCELAQAFQRLGAVVTLIERAPRLLSREDPEVSTFLEEKLVGEGVDVRTGVEVRAFAVEGGQKVARLEGTEPESLPFDTLLVAVGRQARVEGFGLKEVGVTLRDGFIETDGTLQTRVPTIFACGDCVGPHLFTHAASHQAWHAAVNALFSNPFKRFRVDLSHLPRATFTDPEVARVGLNESEAKARGVPYEVTRYDLAGQDRAIAEGEAHGFVKVLTIPGKDRILGATLVGPHAGDLVTSFTLAMRAGFGLQTILGTIHPYPTFAEMNKAVAGQWKRAQTSERTLHGLKRWHRWRRGRSDP